MRVFGKNCQSVDIQCELRDVNVATDGEENSKGGNRKRRDVTFEFFRFRRMTHNVLQGGKEKHLHLSSFSFFLENQICSAFILEAEKLLHTNHSVRQL